MYPKNNASPERLAIGQVILIADGTIQSASVVITVRGQGGSEAAGGGTIDFGSDNTVYYTPTQAETNFTSFVIIASKASCFSASMTVVTSAASTPGQVDLKSVQGTAQTANDNGLDINTLITQVGTAGAGLTNLGASGNNWNTVIPPTVAEFNARTIVSANYTIVSDLGTVQTADHTSAISSIDSVTSAILIDTAQIGVAGAGLTDLATQASVNTIDSNVDAILVDTGTTIPARLTGIEGASFSGSTDSLEAIRDRGDSAWTTGAGGSSPTVVQIRQEMDSNSTQLADIVADTNELQTDNIPGLISTLDAVVDTVKVDTAQIGVAGAGLTNLGASGNDWNTVTPDAAGVAPTAAEINTQVDIALSDIHLDHLFATAYNPASKPGLADALLNELIEDDSGVARYTANALENAPSSSGTGLTAEQTRDALGLASANLDTQLTAATTATGFATPAQVATALTDIHLEQLFASNYDPASKPGSATALLNELVENDGGVARYTVNALENGPSGSGSSAEVIAAAVFNTLQSEHKISGTYGLYLQSNSGYVPASGHASGLTSETAPFNAYEYGQVIRANMKQDISAFTVFEIVIQPEQGSSKNASQLPNRPKGAIIASGADVTVGTVDVTIGDVLYAANEYLQYTTKPDDLSHPGTWRVRGTVVKSAANKLLGDFLRFTVLD
jgi:hypothetical protein